MAEFLNLPTKEQFDIQNALLASIASHVGTGGIKVTSWKDVQQITRMGLADKVFKIGDQFQTTYKGNTVVANIIGINQDIPTDKKYKNSITLQFHNCLENVQFDNSEALYKVKDNPLAAGTYHFTSSGTKYKFTLTQPVPVGGCLTFPWVYNADILITKISSFATQSSTVAIESVNIAVGADGTELLPINHIDRCRYGSSNYKESAIRQWLNSDSDTFVWTPKTDYDRPPSAGAPFNGAGFIKLLDPELAAVIGAVDKQVARNTINEGGGQDLFSDKVFLLSKKEVFGGDEGVVTGEIAYPWYSALAGSPTTAALAGRIKYLAGVARTWWLRSLNVGYSYNLRIVYATGEVSNYFAYYASGLAPAYCIY